METVDRLGLESVGVFDGDWTGESGMAAIESLPHDARPTAVIAANDVVAAGVIRAVKNRGWDVPGDVRVGGRNCPRGLLSQPVTLTSP
ncbi:substrate-binding domain-containing protein, partial [Rhizobium johnstonii]|uniref:substrate-binding domain-containing protein n=1 Tax=Rhizobium johnstonii TaxID=3019933 RepID=UPI003F95354E